MLPWRWLGRVGYADGVAAQEALRRRVLAGDETAAGLILCEHDPVITLGRRARADHVRATAGELAARGIELAHSTRGGDVTYHGPGQLMVYPVVRLPDTVAGFLARLAGALVELADALGVPGAEWRRDPAGLWVGDAKLAACGLHLSRRVCAHGFAFDVATPPGAWRSIVPCGLSGVRTTSIAAERAARGLVPPPPMSEVAALAGPLVARALRHAPPRRASARTARHESGEPLV